MLTTDVPKTDTQLFEFLRQRFGWGTFVDNGADSYLKYRMREVGMIKRMRAKRHITVEHVVMVADYCRAQRLSPGNLTSLMRHDKDARSWRDARLRAEVQAEVRREIDDAIAYELTLEDSPWLDTLIRVGDMERLEVLAEWKRARHR